MRRKRKRKHHMLMMRLMVYEDEDACDLARGCEGSVKKTVVI